MLYTMFSFVNISACQLQMCNFFATCRSQCITVSQHRGRSVDTASLCFIRQADGMMISTAAVLAKTIIFVRAGTLHF